MQQKSSRGVQQHEVEAAADALIAEGLRPTVERVRLKMGRGSPNTVAPMLEAWFAGLAPRLGVVASDAAPAGPPAAVRQGMQQLWDLALQAARDDASSALAGDREALAREREDLASRRSDLDGQLEAAEIRGQLLSEALNHARGQLEEDGQRLREAQALLQQRDRELAEARASIAAVVVQKDAAARAHDQHVERLGAERAKAAERAAATERRHLEEIDKARQDVKAAQKKNSELEARLSKAGAEQERAREAASAAIADLKIERAQLLERLAAAGRQKPVPSKTAVSKKPSTAKRQRAPR